METSSKRDNTPITISPDSREEPTKEQCVKTIEELEFARTELRRYEQAFKAISDHSPDIIARFDRKLRHLYVNAAIEAATGIPAQTFIGKTHHELGLSGEIYTYWGKSCLGVFEIGLEEMMEFDLPTPNGTRWYHARVVPEFGEDGYVETVLSIAHDITERKRAEEELRIYQKYLKNLAEQRTKELAQRNEALQREIEERKRIEERLRFTEFSVERSSIATLWLEADGKIFRINNAASQLLGYSHQELLSMNIHDFKTDLPEGIFPEGWKDFWQELIRSHHFDREFRYKRQNGELRVFEISNNYFEYDERGYCLAFLRDITERKQAETDLQQAKEAAEAANHAKSVFLANMSHEFRTPLNGILGYTQILRRDQSLTAKQHEIIDTMHTSGEHLLLIINDVLDLSKIEAQKMELESKEFHLPTFLKNIVAICRIRAQQQEISFNYETSAGLSESVFGDERCLRQILLNLLGNAIKFTRKGGVILRVSRKQKAGSRRQKAEGGRQKAESVILSEVEGRPVECINENPDSAYSSLPIGHLSFEIEDTGIGIPAEQLEKIFLPFYQAQEKLAHSEGTGLGLTISQRLVRLMKSELHVKSTIGQGSLFWFELDLPEIRGDHLKLEWMYQDEGSFCEPGKESEQAPLILPPQEELANLLNLAMMGDVMSIQDYAAAIKKREPAFTSFSNKLEQLAKDFLVEEIQMFLQRHTGEEL